MFQAAPLRRQLKRQYDTLLSEPPEWGLPAYRLAIKQLSRIEIPGLGVSGPTEELYVWPRARLYDRSRRSDFEDENPLLADYRAEDAIDLRSFPSDQLRQVIVVAGPGYGKSALLTAVASELAEGPLVPVHIPLASFASTHVSITAFLGSQLNQEMDLCPDWQRLAEQGLLVLLLDGLDEVPSVERPALMGRIRTFSVRYPRAPWILTVRDAAVVTGLPEASTIELLPLDDSDLFRFAETMEKYLGGLRSWEFVRRIECYPDLLRLARIPLFLVMLIANRDLFNADHLNRSDLIESYLSTLFVPARHKQVRNPADRSASLRQIAEMLAFERLERQEIGATEREVRSIIDRVTGSPSEATDLFELLIANGILKRQSAVRFQFPYPIVQEYLAARHIIDHYPETLDHRIDDAVQRPWAQVIQFALELHPAPEGIVRAMLARPDDAFRTGLRLVGRCIVNGAAVGPQLRSEIGEYLVEYWTMAPTRSREHVGRLLADGFTGLPTPSLQAAVQRPYLIQYGGGDIASKIGDTELTCRILSKLIGIDNDGIRIYHSLKPALAKAGCVALGMIVEALDPDVRTPEELINISSLFFNFTASPNYRDLALKVARDLRLPIPARLRAYKLAGRPLEQDAITAIITALQLPDWTFYGSAVDLVGLHDSPTSFIADLLRNDTIPIAQRRNLAAQAVTAIPDFNERAAFFDANIADPRLETDLRATLQLFAARFGDRRAIEELVEQIETMPLEHLANTISLFGHFPDRGLGERAAHIVRGLDLAPAAMARIASSASTGMRYILEMDSLWGGSLRETTIHPAVGAWRELLEDWSEAPELNSRDYLMILTAAAELGSERAETNLMALIHEIEDFDAAEWLQEDELGNAMNHALHHVRKISPQLSPQIIERLLLSKRYNIASRAIDWLAAQGDREALLRIIDIHTYSEDWLLRDTAANTVELLAGRLGVAVHKEAKLYTLGN
ncbi:NACHT domain-containing protein [Methylobacterium sp. UNC378MF]|nr:NACHT domain-containing protein [Methylobacterium sp. UNC378MF]